MNYVWLTRKLVSGTFVIDPTLKVPSSPMPPLVNGATRRNLYLDSRLTADVEVYLVDGETQQSQLETSRPWTMLYVQSRNDVRVKLVCSLAVNLQMNLICMVQHARGLAAGRRAPYHLQISATYLARVHIPRDFRGSLSLSTMKDDSVHLSDDLSRNTTTFRDIGTEMKFFVGDLAKSGGEGECDAIFIGSRNRPSCSPYSIMVGYLDEIIEQETYCCSLQ